MESGWANLPKDLLDSILERLILSSSNYVRFSMVCKPWFGAAKDNQSRQAKKLLSHPEPPMLLFFNGKEDAWNLYNVVENKVLDVQLKLPNKRFCGSSKGWLIVVEKDFAVTLINPFSKSKGKGERENLAICLPQLNPPPEYSSREELEELWAEDCEYFVLKATITADPILNPNDCIVVIIQSERCELAFIRPSKDTSWTYMDNKCCGIMDVHVLQDKFYVVKDLGELLTLNINSESNSNVNSIAPAGRDENCVIRAYLVDSNGRDLLMIQRHCSWEYCETLKIRFATEFKAFRFNSDKCQWIEEKTLGDDVAIFVGENVSISVVASNFPGCKGNCIYYNHDFDLIQMNDKLHDFGVYDMEKKSISKPYSNDVMTLLEMVNQRPIWFMPTFQAL